jgi:hypothetical protein
MDTVGREVAFLSILQLQGNREALIEVLRGIVAAPVPAEHGHVSEAPTQPETQPLSDNPNTDAKREVRDEPSQ